MCVNNKLNVVGRHLWTKNALRIIEGHFVVGRARRHDSGARGDRSAVNL